MEGKRLISGVGGRHPIFLPAFQFRAGRPVSPRFCVPTTDEGGGWSASTSGLRKRVDLHLTDRHTIFNSRSETQRGDQCSILLICQSKRGTSFFFNDLAKSQKMHTKTPAAMIDAPCGQLIGPSVTHVSTSPLIRDTRAPPRSRA
jgi:hypothetical protein